MSWNWVDITVILLAVVQVALCVAIAVVVGRIKNGSVAQITATVRRNIVSGKRLVDTGGDAAKKSLPHIMATRTSLMKLPKAFRPVEFDDAPVTYGSLMRGFTSLTTLTAFTRPVKTTPSGKRVVRPSLADRMGLVPPAWKKVAPLIGYASMAIEVWKQVQEQLPEIRERILSARDTD